MKITILQSSLWLSGGGRVVVEYANRLSKRGHALSIVIPKGTVSPELGNLLDPSVVIREARRPLMKPIGAIDQARLAISMARAVPKSDVIVATHTPTTIVSLIAGNILRRGTPVWFYMDYPGMFTGRRVETWLLYNAIRWHKSALVLSSHSAQEINSFGARQCYQVGLGLNEFEDVKLLTQQVKPLLNKGKKSILYLGDLRPRKGLADFLQAAELLYPKMPEIELWIALKDGGEVKTNLPFQYFNRPSVKELAQLYSSCNLFVSASWYEGFGLPPLEAMACGAPVVVTDSGGVRDFAVNGENCLLIPTRNPQAMAEAMWRVLSNPNLESKLRQNGPDSAKPYTWDKASIRFEQALQESISFSQ